MGWGDERLTDLKYLKSSILIAVDGNCGAWNNRTFKRYTGTLYKFKLTIITWKPGNVQTRSVQIFIIFCGVLVFWDFGGMLVHLLHVCFSGAACFRCYLTVVFLHQKFSPLLRVIPEFHYYPCNCCRSCRRLIFQYRPHFFSPWV